MHGYVTPRWALARAPYMKAPPARQWTASLAVCAAAVQLASPGLLAMLVLLGLLVDACGPLTYACAALDACPEWPCATPVVMAGVGM